MKKNIHILLRSENVFRVTTLSDSIIVQRVKKSILMNIWQNLVHRQSIDALSEMRCAVICYRLYLFHIWPSLVFQILRTTVRMIYLYCMLRIIWYLFIMELPFLEAQ